MRDMREISQKRMEKLDKIGQEHGFDLYMPPSGNCVDPFFIITKLRNPKVIPSGTSAKSHMLIKNLIKAKFSFVTDIIQDKFCILIKG